MHSRMLSSVIIICLLKCCEINRVCSFHANIFKFNMLFGLSFVVVKYSVFLLLVFYANFPLFALFICCFYAFNEVMLELISDSDMKLSE